MPLADARERAREARCNVAKGADPATEKQAARDALTFGKLAAEYIETHAEPHKKSWKEDQRQLDADLLPTWKNPPAAEIGRADVRELLDSKIKTGAKVAANRLRALVSRSSISP